MQYFHLTLLQMKMVVVRGKLLVYAEKFHNSGNRPYILQEIAMMQ